MIAILQPVIPHYRDDFFEKLSARVSCDIYVYDKPQKAIKANIKLSNLTTIPIKRLLFAGILLYSISSFLLKKYTTLVLMSNIGHISTWFLLLTKPLHKKKIILWGHGISVKRYFREESHPSILLKFMMKKADVLWLYTEKEADTWRRYFPDKEIVSLNNTISNIENIELINSIEEKNALKEKYQIQQSCIFIFCARFENKYRRADLLEKIIQQLDKETYGFIIIGNGKYKPNFTKYTNVYDFGAVYDQVLKNDLFAMSDAYFQPAWNGLSIVEAMAYAKPVFTFRRSDSIIQCVEYSYIHEGENGLIFEDLFEACQKLNSLTRETIQELGENARNFVMNKLTMHNMVNIACSTLFIHLLEEQDEDKITLFFWQNCVSPHQLPYIKELHKDNRVEKVYLIAPVSELFERKSMGWEQSLNTIDGIEIIIAPNENRIIELFKKSHKNDIHLFSGIRGFKEVFVYFKCSLKFNLNRGIITEPPNLYRKPLFLHKIRFLFFDYQYIPKIDYVFAMGSLAANYYQSWSVKWKVFLFGYCVDNYSIQLNRSADNMIKFVFVGSLIKLKNVILLLHAIKSLDINDNFSLDIIGDGPEFETLKKYVVKNDLTNKVSFVGKLSMKEVHNKLPEYDVLILPSIYDGWGAVINEGLKSGLYIISSDICGASTLIENSNRGIVFKNNNLTDITASLQYCLQNKVKIKSDKQNRIDWSEKISGNSLATYMINCLSTNDTVLPPWKN
jgi:Glycosyltransferase